MKTSIVLATIASLALATSAFAQSTSDQKSPEQASKDKNPTAATVKTPAVTHMKGASGTQSGTTGAAAEGARKKDANEKP